IDLHAIRVADLAGFGSIGGVEKGLAIAVAAVGLQLEHHVRGVVGSVAIGDVEFFLVGREGEAVGARHLFGDERQLAVLREAIDAAEIQLAPRIVFMLWQAVDRVGEEEIAIGLEYEVVRAVEALALVVVGQRPLAAILGEDRNAAVAVFALCEAALRIERVGVGAGLAAVIDDACVAGGLHIDRNAFAV